jgi:hypothetical protein
MSVILLDMHAKMHSIILVNGIILSVILITVILLSFNMFQYVSLFSTSFILKALYCMTL